MDTSTASQILGAFYTTYLQNRFGSDVSYPEAALVAAREAYTHVDPQEARAAFHGFKRKGIEIGACPPPVAAFFTLGDGPDRLIVAGYDTGERWNGWACPLLPRDSVEALNAWMMRDGRPGCCDKAAYILDGDVVRITHDDDCCDSQTIEPTMVSVVEGAPTTTRGESDPHELELWDVGDGMAWVAYPFVLFGGGAWAELVLCPSCWRAQCEASKDDPEQRDEYSLAGAIPWDQLPCGPCEDMES